MINVKTRLTSFKIGAAFGVNRQLRREENKNNAISFKFTLTSFDRDIHYVRSLFH